MRTMRVTVPLLLNVEEGTREGVVVDGAEEEVVGEGEADKRDQVSEKKMPRAARSLNRWRRRARRQRSEVKIGWGLCVIFRGGICFVLIQHCFSISSIYKTSSYEININEQAMVKDLPIMQRSSMSVNGFCCEAIDERTGSSWTST